MHKEAHFGGLWQQQPGKGGGSAQKGGQEGNKAAQSKSWSQAAMNASLEGQ